MFGNFQRTPLYLQFSLHIALQYCSKKMRWRERTTIDGHGIQASGQGKLAYQTIGSDADLKVYNNIH